MNKIEQGPADQLLRRGGAEQANAGTVDEHEFAVLVNVNGIGRQLDQLAIAGLHLRHRKRGALALRNVAGNNLHSGLPAKCERRRCHFDFHSGTVRAQVGLFHWLRCFAVLDLHTNALPDQVTELGRHKIHHRPTQQVLRSRRTKQRDTGTIQIDVLQVLVDEDGIRRKFDQAAIAVLGLAQGAFCRRAPADVLHGADHAYRRRILVVDHKAAVVDVGVCPVTAPKTVFVAPGLASRVDQSMDAVDYAGLVLGMNRVVPGFDSRSDFVGPVTEQRLVPLVPPDAVGGEVPVPDCVVGCPGNDPEPLHIAEQDVVGALALDGNAGERCDGLDRVEFACNGGAWLAVVHGQGSQYLATFRNDRMRPAGAQSISQGDITELCPEGIDADVSHHDQFLAVGGGPA